MNISSRCIFRKKLIALLLSVCLAAAFVPTVGAESSEVESQSVDSAEFIVQTDDVTKQPADTTTQPADTTTQPADTTTQPTDTTTRATQTTKSSTQTSSSNTASGFENVETDGGVLFVGTARTPKEGGGISTVKFVYSSSLNLNDKSLALINTELSACGVTIPDGMIYVSESDIVSDSQLMTKTSEKQAVFAVGSPSAPTVLKAYQPYGSVEESFERLFRGYIFSIIGYTSLRPVLDGREEVTLSEDGQTASVSIVMSEDYVEKVINGKKIKILMINSELKYYFRAPKLTFEKDEDYNVSDSDVVYHYPTRSTTDPSDTLTTVSSQITITTTDPFTDDENVTGSTTEPTAATTDTTASAAVTEPTLDSDSTTTTEYSDPFGDDSTTEPTQATLPTDNDDTPSTTTTESTRPNVTDGNYDWLDRLIPYAQPIDGGTLQTSGTTKRTKATTEPTTESTTEPTTEPTSRFTLPTTTQPTNPDSFIDPFNHRELNTVGEAYINTRRLPLNIRTGPGLNYMVITVLPKGTHLTVIDTSNADWYMVKLKNGSVGYAYSYYIKFV